MSFVTKVVAEVMEDSLGKRLMKRPEQTEVEALVVALILAGRDGMKLGESTGNKFLGI